MDTDYTPAELAATSPYGDDYRNPNVVADGAVGALFATPDHQTRLGAIKILRDRLSWVQAVTLKALEVDLGSVEHVADQIGVSRQAVHEIYRRNEMPAARVASRIDTPAYRAGALIAWIETVDRDLWYRYWPLILGGSGHALTNMYETYERIPARRRKGRDGLTDALIQVVPELPGLRRHLDPLERSHIILGYYHQLALWRSETEDA